MVYRPGCSFYEFTCEWPFFGALSQSAIKCLLTHKTLGIKQRKSNINLTNWCWSCRITEVLKPNLKSDTCLKQKFISVKLLFAFLSLNPDWKATVNNRCMQRCCCGGFYISLMVFQLETLKRSLINTEWMGTQHACKQMELFLSLGQRSTERQATCHYAKDASSGFTLVLCSLSLHLPLLSLITACCFSSIWTLLFPHCSSVEFLLSVIS